MGAFRAGLAGPGLAAVAEVKRRSPSAGDLRPDADPARLTAQFGDAGAAAVSVLVDERFGGSLDDLLAARAATALPLLAKGFFREERQLLQLKQAGAGQPVSVAPVAGQDAASEPLGATETN